MSVRKYFTLALFMFFLSNSFAAEPVNYKLYGFVSNDFYYNSRQNLQSLDGLYNIFPLPVSLDSKGNDQNATPSAEMLSIFSRLGFNFTGTTVFGAKASAKIECDFAGVPASYFLISLRQAYAKLNWDKTELLIGQTWHPMFGSVYPTVVSLNTGNPFQPFNRSPQVRVTQKLFGGLSVIGSANYQMQYLSQGPLGSSATYIKNTMLPSMFVGLESKTENWTTGLGFDTKTLKINNASLTSASGMAYAQFAKNKLQIKAKAIYGENLSDYIMIGGYGVSSKNSLGADTYTNINTLTSWLNIVYGSKVQVGIFGGISQNLGSNRKLADLNGNFTAYGYGFYAASQEQMDRLYRVSPSVSYNVSNFKFALEYELTSATYGKIKANGLVSSPYNVNNHRAIATVVYSF